ncbi:MAG: M1 family metallopeptidase [Flavobacteriaceae bacterium]|nr:M1 family metallopeptidase [Flavobacteriaceae bacterium]
MKNLIALFLISLTYFSGFAQQTNFSKQDTLRGSITPERIWWNLLHYNLDFKVSPSSKSIEGSNLIRYKVLSQNQLMQIDLQPPMKITSVLENNKSLDYKRNGNAYYIVLKKNQQIGAINEITIHFEGAPKISNNPPWDDGFTWEKDKNGTDFIATSCQGGGSSIWWPSKDHMYDEPDQGIELSITAPKHLISVSNGRHIQTKENSNKTNTSNWKVINPINNYGVNINIGDYVHFTEEYKGKKGVLDCDYYVVSYNLEKAKKQFKEVSRTLEAFEHWFGPYPFYEDSYKLVEVPYLGMEHQSSVTYGNGYKNGYKGIDLSGTGWGLKFDFIIVHESGHEWFANNITNIDIADMWIHESFTAYSENLFLDYHFGTEASNAYVTGTRKNIQNDKPIIGNYNVNNSGSSDMYYKGANMLHTLRQIIDNDKKWRSILVGLNKDFYHQTVTTLQIENYIDKYFEIDLKPFFNQYLRTIKIPTLDYKLENNNLLYKWSNVIDGFSIPIKVFINSTSQWIRPTSRWKKLLSDKNINSFSVDNNFYIETENKLD